METEKEEAYIKSELIENSNGRWVKYEFDEDEDFDDEFDDEVTDIFDDEKILLIESLPAADSIIVIWFKLLCLAGKQNNSGVFMLNDKIPYTEEMLATIFRREPNTVRLALETFERFGMIERFEGVITIPNWGKHQNLDQLENKKQYMRNYMKEYRSKQKLLADKSNCKTNSKANVSSADKELEEDYRYKNEI